MPTRDSLYIDLSEHPSVESREIFETYYRANTVDDVRRIATECPADAHLVPFLLPK